MNRITLFLVIFILGAASCIKEESNLITGNNAPKDEAITPLSIDNYINRVYISLLGRKASDSEFIAAQALFQADPAAQANRITLLAQVQANPEYKTNLVYRTKLDLLEGVDSATIIRDYQQILAILQDPSKQSLYPAYEVIKLKLEALLEISANYQAGAIHYMEVQRRCIDNMYYDQINMGTENFVVSMFQHFLDRYPSGQELSNGKAMVDGNNSSLFLQTGVGKDEFISIFFNSSAYAEGLVHNVARQYLFRKATQDEVLLLAPNYLQGFHIEAVHAYYLSSDEYFKQ